jgi:hypothetical protein
MAVSQEPKWLIFMTLTMFILGDVHPAPSMVNVPGRCSWSMGDVHPAHQHHLGYPTGIPFNEDNI